MTMGLLLVRRGRAAHADDVRPDRFDQGRRNLPAGQVIDWPRVSSGLWASRADWNRDKPGYAWLFDRVDRDGDGRISADEYRAFQEFKHGHADWEQTLRKQAPGG